MTALAMFMFIVQAILALIFICGAINVLNKENRTPDFTEIVVLFLLIYVLLTSLAGMVAIQ